MRGCASWGLASVPRADTPAFRWRMRAERSGRGVARGVLGLRLQRLAAPVGFGVDAVDLGIMDPQRVEVYEVDALAALAVKGEFLTVAVKHNGISAQRHGLCDLQWVIVASLPVELDL